MHPGARILLCVLSALALPGLSFFYLGLLTPLLLWPGLSNPARTLALFKRTRWLFLALFIGYGFSLPGSPLIGGWDWSPTREGLEAGLVQAWRLAMLLLLVEWSILRLPAKTLLEGLYSLLRPFGRLGLPAERAALRLGLTMQSFSEVVGSRKGLRQVLDAEDLAGRLPEMIELQVSPWRGRDYLIVLMVCVAMVLMWLNG